MDIKVEKLDARRLQSVVIRDDRVTLRVPGFGPSAPLPHDLAHYVVEKELGLRRGFWGSVADGAVFRGMTVLDGRQRPHARDRSHALCKANSRSLTDVEVVVGVLVGLVRNKIPATSPFAAKMVARSVTPTKGSEVRAITAANLQRIGEGLTTMARRWSEVEVGDALVLRW
jgi:hypothetical protein